MELLYLDYNCYQRGFDDPRQVRIQEVAMMDDTEVRVRGIEILNQALGPAAALRFLALLHREPTDYVEVSRRLYEGHTIDDIFDRARRQWRG